MRDRKIIDHSIPGWLPCLLLLMCLACVPADAEPFLAVQMGLKCTQCHVNPTGGGLRSVFGDVFAQTTPPARRLGTSSDMWLGEVDKFLRAGGDLRAEASLTHVPHTQTLNQFQLEQSRVYLEANVIPERLIVYADEQVAPGGALNREAYALYWSAAHDWYVKGGQMYLPFGWRLQDQTAFVQQISGINMTTPDQGVEFGWLRGRWDGQLAISNGTAGGAATQSGKQYSSQLSYVYSLWRVGLAANLNNKVAGNKSALAIFAGLHTGPVAWLGELDFTEDKSLQNGAGRRMAARLLEANWQVVKGSNLKLTGEFLDPDRSVHNNGRTRWSVVYELAPMEFTQIRAGIRYQDGIPQDNSQHTKLYFLEWHGFF